MTMSRSGRALAAMALAGAAVLAAAGPAGADDWPTRTCAPGEVSARISERPSPSADDRLFTIALQGREGVSCLLSGALDYIRFYDTSGRPLDVRFSDKAAVAPFDQVLVDDLRAAVVYVAAPKGGGGRPIGGMAFSVPTAPETEMKAAWPSPVLEPLRITEIMGPVS
ncbi:MAG: hypothetical protein HOV68_03070 [Streptomycetaceae bacterium]|nr:hypothetical protein [Streptomycetaceae bacterium]